ncbi:MAG: hypothetical protein AAB262_11855 [Elusimicrobiota bacterium]
MTKAQAVATQDYLDALERFYKSELAKEEARSDIREAQARIRKLARQAPPVKKGNGDAPAELF